MKNTSLPPPDLNSLCDLALQAAQVCGEIQRSYFKRLHRLKIRHKEQAGLVTEADLESEKAAKKILSRAGPQFGFLGEEGAYRCRTRSSKSLPRGHRRLAPPRPPGTWIVDPLDGTTNFVHGFQMFCISIAAQWEGTRCLGVIYQPLTDWLFVALRNQGATLNGKQIHVSSTKRVSDSLLGTGFSTSDKSAAWFRDEVKAFQKISRVAQGIRRPGSAALDLALTACGIFDGFWEKRLSPWDVASGLLLVEEAGGKVTDFSGESLVLSVDPKRSENSTQVLATNGRIHNELKTLLQA